MIPHIRLRPVTDADRPFLLAVYSSTREAELAQTDWSDEVKGAFLASQFEAQDAYYRANYEGAEYFVIEVGGERAGRLYIQQLGNLVRLMDIALLPPFRGRGIGSRLMADILADAAARGAAVHIHVEIFNPALHLYERLGFRRTTQHGVYVRMEWKPKGAA